MKAMTLTVPVVLVAMIFLFVWAMGMLTVKSGVVATKGSLELLRLHVQVARMHDALLLHSKQSVEEHLNLLSAQAAAGHAPRAPESTFAADPALAPAETAANAPAAKPLETATGTIGADHPLGDFSAPRSR